MQRALTEAKRMKGHMMRQRSVASSMKPRGSTLRVVRPSGMLPAGATAGEPALPV